MLLSELETLRAKSGFTGYPVTSDGAMGSRLLGLVTKRDTDFVKDKDVTRVGSIMTKVEELVTAEEGVSMQAAWQLLRDSKRGKLPVVSKEKRLVALMARCDLQKNAEYPNATKDANNRLMVAAAVGTRPADRDRVGTLAAAGVDAIVVDSSQGDSKFQHEMVRWAKKEFPDLQIVAG